MPFTKVHFTFPLLLLAVNILSSSGQRLVGTVYGVNNAASLNVYQHSGGGAQTTYSILASTYDTGRNTYDNAYILFYPGQAISSGFDGYRPRLIYNLLFYPKELAQVPSRVFNFDAISIPDGSTIVGKTSGSIYITNVNDFSFPATVDILKPRLPITTSYMYSNLVWLQADAGLTWDIVTCRVLIESGTVKEAQLVWIDHPSLNDMSSQWSLNVLKESACDTNVALVSLSTGGIGNNYEVVYTTGFHLRRLAFFYTTNNFGRWTDPTDIVGVVLEQGRQFYDVQIVDVNRDGKQDILTTVVDRTNGTVEVWEIPNDFRNGDQYVRHVIAAGFAARTGGTEGRSPGVARPFYPTGGSQQKPWIAVTGGDDGRAYVLSPQSQAVNDWNYQLTTVVDYGLIQSVTGITAADVDGDGYAELFVSVRGMNYVQVFSYSPAV